MEVVQSGPKEHPNAHDTLKLTILQRTILHYTIPPCTASYYKDPYLHVVFWALSTMRSSKRHNTEEARKLEYDNPPTPEAGKEGNPSEIIPYPYSNLLESAVTWSLCSQTLELRAPPSRSYAPCKGASCEGDLGPYKS